MKKVDKALSNSHQFPDGTDIFFGQLFGWSSRPEVFGFNKDLVADLEVGWGQTFSVCGPLVALLSSSHLSTEVFVQRL